MKKILSVFICLALFLSFAVSVSADTGYLILNDWSLAADDPNFMKSDTTNGAGRAFSNESLPTTILYTKVATTGDNQSGIEMKNTGDVSTGSEATDDAGRQNANFGIFANSVYTDLTGYDTMRIRIDASKTTNDSLVLTMCTFQVLSQAGCTTLYDMNHDEADADSGLWGLPVIPAGFNGYLVIDLTALSPVKTGYTYDMVQANFFNFDSTSNGGNDYVPMQLQFMPADEGLLPGESIVLGQIAVVTSDDMWAGVNASSVTVAPTSAASVTADTGSATTAPATSDTTGNTSDFPTVPVAIGAAVVIIAVIAEIIFVSSKKKGGGSEGDNAAEKNAAGDKKD